MPVVLMDPGSEMAQAMGGVLIKAGIGPFADGGLDEALGFAIGAWGVDAGADGLDVQLAAGLGEAPRTEAGTVVGHDASNGDVQAQEVSHGLAQEAAGGDSLFVGEQGSEGEAGVVVDGDVKKLPTGAPGFVLGIAGEAMAGLMNTGQLLDVDMEQVAGGGMFVAHDGHSGFEHTDFVELQPGQDPAYGGAAQSGRLRDSHPSPALASQPLHLRYEFRRGTSRRSTGTRAAIAQPRPALGAEPSHPLGRALPAELELGRSRVQAQPTLQHFSGKFFSTMNRKSSMMVIVHSVSSVAWLRNLSFPVLDRMDNNLLKLHI